MWEYVGVYGLWMWECVCVNMGVCEGVCVGGTVWTVCVGYEQEWVWVVNIGESGCVNCGNV